MSAFRNPFDPDVKLGGGCSCASHSSSAEHEAAHVTELARSNDAEALQSRVVENAVMRALFPHDATRRSFIRAVGSSTALAAISSLFPLAAAKEAFAQNGKIEKPNLKVGFIPITCATPIIMSQPMGFYGRQGLNVDVVKTAGWAVIRDKTINKEYDAAHMLSP
ncbi:MAG: NMT1-like family protein, partial [Betaproteobacteria bacterium]|nr:NMT1-like family protein [Betaproteobacteria bacterium]